MPHEGIPKDWFLETVSGVKIYPACPEKSIGQILLFDIANALSKVCRFGGHLERFYSVASHSLNCSYIIEENYHTRYKYKLAMLALMHDSAEAYMTDLPTPIKKLFPGFSELEKEWQTVIFEDLHIIESDELWDKVHKVDNYVLHQEANTFQSRNGWSNKDGGRLNLHALHQSPDHDVVAYEFIRRFNFLTIKIKGDS